VNLSQLDRTESARAEWLHSRHGTRATAGVDRGAVLELGNPEAFGKAPALLVVRQ
jgi:hypothetical protein